MAENENKAYDFRHNILGLNGLSTASDTFTMKSPLMGSGGSGGAGTAAGFTITYNHFIEFTEGAPKDTYKLTCDKTFSELVAMYEEASNNHEQVLGKLIGQVMAVDGGEPIIMEEYTDYYGRLFYDKNDDTSIFVIFTDNLVNKEEWPFDSYGNSENSETKVIHIFNPDLGSDRRAYGLRTMKMEVTALDGTVPEYFDADGNQINE